MTAACSVGMTATVALLPVQWIRFAYESENIHVALETTAALVAGAAAFLFAGQASQRARRADVLLAAALATLALTNLAFGAVPELVDPHKLLTGDGDRMRHITIKSVQDVKPQYLEELIREAVLLNRAKGDPTKRA